MTPFIRPAAVRRADRLLGLSVFLILLAAYTATMATQPDTLDGEVEYQTTSSLARERTLALGGTPEADAIVAWSQGERTGFNCRPGGPGREHETFSWFGVGQALVGVPFYYVGAALARLCPAVEALNAGHSHMGVARSEYFAHLLVGWRNPLLAALTGMLLVLSARRMGASRPSAWIAALAYGLCTFAWPQARSTFNSVQATFFLFLAFDQVLVVEEVFGRYRRPPKLALVLFGSGLGMAFLTRSLTAPAIAVLAVAMTVVVVQGAKQLARRAVLVDLVWAFVPALAGLAVFLVTNVLRFGDPLEQGYGGVVTWEGYFGFPVHEGLGGLLLAPGRGLLWMAPGVLLLPVWVRRQWVRGDRRALVLVAAVALAVLVPPAMTTGWHGGVGYGPRYALPLLPFLWLAVAPALDALREAPLARRLALALLATGFLVSLPGVLVDSTTHTSLALEATQLAYPPELLRDAPPPGPDREAWFFDRMQWDPRFAAPWAHWRILRHRVATGDDRFPVGEVFFLEGEEGERVLEPPHARERGFAHLAWVDFRRRLDGPLWPVVLFSLTGLVLGATAAMRGLDTNRR